MDYAELLFATKVRDLASALRTAASSEYAKHLALEGDAKWEMVEQWKLENPIANFVPQALAQIKEVAAIIKSQ